MKQAQSIAQLHHPQIEKARAKHQVLQRGAVEEQRSSMQVAGDLMWPLVAAAMSDQKLPSRMELDTPAKRVLFKLSHPNFDWTAFEEAARREHAGTAMSDEERKAHIGRAQLDADALSSLTGGDVNTNYDGVLPETGGFNRSLDGRRRFLLWAAFQRADFDAVSKREGDHLMFAYRRWSWEKTFYVCQAMDKLIAYLQGLSTVAIVQLRARYKADLLPLGRIEWRGRAPNEVLAAAIISACVVDHRRATFRENAKLATKLIKAFDLYQHSCRTVDRCHPKASNANHLKIKLFQRLGLGHLS